MKSISLIHGMLVSALLIALFPSLFAQHHTVANQVSSSFAPFQIRHDISLPKELNQGVVLELNTEELNQLLTENHPLLLLKIPHWKHETLNIELLQQQPLVEDFQIKGSKNGKFTVDAGKHYAGIIQHKPKTLAAFSFFHNQIAALIATPQDGNLNLVKWKADKKSHNSLYLLYPEEALPLANPFVCQTPDFDSSYEVSTQKVERWSNRSTFCRRPIDVYIECDHIMYQDFGGDVQSIFEFVVSVVHFSAALFHKEEVATQLSEMFVWETPDAFTDDDAFDALVDFRDYLQGDFNATFAQLFSTYQDGEILAPNGGLAYIGTICSPTTAVGYSNITSSFQAIPTYSWTVTIFSHELGHGLSSKHTHACIWGPNEDMALDDCFETEGNCSLGAPPVTGGTIMSYCHLSEFGVNLSNGFGQEPGDKIRTAIANSACLASGTADFEASIGVDGNTHLEEGETTILIAFPNGPDYYFQWYLDGEFLEGIVFPAIEVSGGGTFTVEVIHNGCIETSNSVTITTGTQQEINLFCSPNCFACVGQSVLLETNAVAGASFEWSTGATTPTIEVNETGIYEVTITNEGNTSVASSVVNFTQERRTDVVNICEGHTYTIGNSTYQESGLYTDFVTNDEGCLIEVTTQLSVLTAPEQNQSLVICEGESVMVGTSVYTQSGNYSDVLIDIEGCFYTLNTSLSVLPNIDVENNISICEGGSYTVGNSIYFEAGTYTDVLEATNACDSTIITHLSIASNYTIDLIKDICEGETYTLGGETYTSTGIYTQSFVASDGCDSIVNLNLTVHETPTTTQAFEVCEGQSITIGGTVYTETGVYTNHFISSNNCDSTVITQLSVFPNYENDLFVSICEGGSYSIGDETYTQQGNYTLHFSSINGCDSVVQLQLFVSNEVVVEEELSLCFGATYEGEVYTQSTFLETNGTSSTGCDSTHILNIEVLPPILIEENIEHGNCNVATASISLDVSGGSGGYIYQWSNGSMTSSIENLAAGNYAVTITDDFACTQMADYEVETAVVLAMEYEVSHVHCFGGSTGAIEIDIVSGTPPYSLFWSSGQLEEDLSNIPAGNYTLFLSDANSCSSETLIEVNEPEAIQLQTTVTPTSAANNDGTASATASGGTPPYHYLWSNGATTPSIDNLSAGDYSLTLTDANACTEITTVTIEPISNIENIENIAHFEVLPNPNNGLFTLTLDFILSEQVTVELFNLIGQPLYPHFSFKKKNIQQTINLEQANSGVYFLVVKSANWQLTERLVVVK